MNCEWLKKMKVKLQKKKKMLVQGKFKCYEMSNCGKVIKDPLMLLASDRLKTRAEEPGTK